MTYPPYDEAAHRAALRAQPHYNADAAHDGGGARGAALRRVATSHVARARAARRVGVFAVWAE